MRFSTVSLLALPLMAVAAQDSPLDQAFKQAQSWFNYISDKIPSPSAPHTPHAAAAKAGGKTLNVLTLNDWEDVLKNSLKPGANAESPPVEWWILLTGGNKTCHGFCGQIEKAFNETAALWSVDPTAPQLGYVNCELQPVLCNSWAGGPPTLWILEYKPRPAASDLYVLGLNATSTTLETFSKWRLTKSYTKRDPYTGYFHPLDGPIAVYGLQKAVGYFFWVFTIIPSWAFMILMSFASRSIMGNRLNPGAPAQPAAQPAAAGRRVGAPPGDGTIY